MRLVEILGRPNRARRVLEPPFRGRNRPPRVEPTETMADEYTLGDVVRLIDGLAESTLAGFDRLDGRIDALTTEVRALTTEVRTGFDRVDRRLAHIETRVEDVEGRVTALEARP
jgi:hypothetical protein